MSLQPISHQGPCGDDGYWYEYVLPLSEKDVLEEHRAAFSPWFERYFEHTPTQVREQLIEDWRGIPEGPAARFRDYLAGKLPKSIGIDFPGGEIGISLGLFPIDDDRSPSREFWPAYGGESMYVREPRSITDTRKNAISSNETVTAFRRFFYGISEGPPFLNRIAMNGVSEWSEEVFQGEFRDGLLLFVCASEGNMIHMVPNGHIYFFDGEGGPERVWKWADSFEEFVDQYLQYLSATALQREFIFY